MMKHAAMESMFSTMNPMLNDLELPQVQEIATVDQRTLAEHKPPGMEGSLLQNMGRRPTRLALWGIASGPDAQSFAEKLDGKFRNGKPLSFTVDIIADSRIDKMLIENLRVQDLAGKPQRYSYVLSLREYIEPVTAEDTSSVDAAVQDDARNLMDAMLPGLTGGLDFITGLEKFVAPLSSLLTGLQNANKNIQASSSH
jgi:hypothetical protein